MNPERSPQDLLLAEILGFDPLTGTRLAIEKGLPNQPPDIVEQIIGFRLATGERIFQPSNEKYERPVRDAFERYIESTSGNRFTTIVESGNLFTAINRGAEVVRCYHYYNPNLPISRQTFPELKKIVLETKGRRFGPVAPEGYRLKSIGSIEYPSDKRTEIFLDSDEKVSIEIEIGDDEYLDTVYYQEELSLATRTKDGRSITFELPKEKPLEVTTAWNRFIFPRFLNKKTAEFEDELLQSPKLREFPFGVDTAEDNSWNERDDFLLMLGIRKE